MKKIELTAPHEHAGRNYPVGSELTLADDEADWLVALKVAAPAGGKPPYPRAVDVATPETTKEKPE